MKKSDADKGHAHSSGDGCLPGVSKFLGGLKGRHGQKLQYKTVYVVCFGALICTLVLWGAVRQAGLSTQSSAPQEPVKQLTPEEVKRQLRTIDKQLQQVLNVSKQFTKFGPRIHDWDKQRELAKQKYANATGSNNKKPRIMLITSSHPQACDNKQGDQMLLKAIKNKMDYCRLHGIEIYYNMDKIDDEMDIWWVKVFLTHMLMLEHPEVDWFWWMDSDAIFTNMNFQLPLDKYKGYNLVAHGWDDAIYDKRSWLGLNAGVFILRNCQWSMDLLHSWAPMSPKGAIRDTIGPLLSSALPDRPQGEADDQSALVYLMVTDRKKWGSKVFLENSYYFQGYWRILTENYEDMMAKYEPDAGEHQYPFVTHFCGCEFCCGAPNREYTRDQCIKQMERACNFADNQIIERYGFQHRSLETIAVEPIRPTPA